MSEQMDILRWGASEILSEEELARKLERSAKQRKSLTVKLGCDPSRPDLHLGHAVVLRKLRQFQDLGHTAILVIGDFTGMIGDPSGQNKARPQLFLEETRRHGRTYLEQASLVLSKERLKVKHNSEWLAPMTFEEVIRLAGRYTVARMLERDDFEQRYRGGAPIAIHEFLYPLAQAMDSIVLKADVELGGTDQKFNLLVGRELQRDYGQEPQVVVVTPLLEGTDGVKKMSKSHDNYIALTDSPDEQYGKIMSIPDALIPRYFEYATTLSSKEWRSLKDEMDSGAHSPRDAKRRLAREVVALYHSPEEAKEAEGRFDRMFVQRRPPEEMSEVAIGSSPARLVEILIRAGLAESRGEAKRLIEQGAVTVEGERVSDINATLTITAPKVIRAGKRRYARVRP